MRTKTQEMIECAVHLPHKPFNGVSQIFRKSLQFDGFVWLVQLRNGYWAKSISPSSLASVASAQLVSRVCCSNATLFNPDHSMHPQCVTHLLNHSHSKLLLLCSITFCSISLISTIKFFFVVVVVVVAVVLLFLPIAQQHNLFHDIRLSLSLSLSRANIQNLVSFIVSTNRTKSTKYWRHHFQIAMQTDSDRWWNQYLMS